jgi:hypothetical protein
MHAASKIAAPLAVLMFAALTLSACYVAPAPYGGGYYAEPAPVYVGPSYYYGPRHGYWRGGGGWHGGGWHHGGGHHWH